MATDFGGFAKTGGPVLVDQFGRSIRGSAPLNYRRDDISVGSTPSAVKFALTSPFANGSLRLTKNGNLLTSGYTVNSPVSFTLGTALTSTDTLTIEYLSAYQTGPSVLVSAFYPLQLFSAGERGVWIDPSQISSLWQDTSGTVPVTAAGQSVALAKDLSGNGNHFIQATPANRPTYQVDGSGYPYLQFTATNSTYLYQNNTTNPLYLGTTGYSLLFAIKIDSSPSANWGVFARSYAGGSAGRYYSVIGGLLAATSKYDVDGTNLIATNYTYPDVTSRHVIVNTMDRTGITAATALDGAATGGQVGTHINDTATNQTTNYACMMGAYPDASLTATGTLSGSFLDGKIYGMILRIAPIDTTKNSNAQTWLGNKIGRSI